VRPSNLAHRVLLAGCLTAAVAVSSPAETGGLSTGGSPHPPGAALIPEELLVDLGPAAIAVHDYGSMRLVWFEGDPPERLRGRAHVLPAAERVGFRGWSGPAPDSIDLTDADGGLFIVALVGPMDPSWRTELEAFGVRILAPAHPNALVVSAGGAGLEAALRITTTEGLPIIRGAMALPLEARVHRSLVPMLGAEPGPSDVELRLAGFGGRPLSEETKHAVGGGATVRWLPADLGRHLTAHPEIGYVEPVLAIELHNNLAARSNLAAVEPLWNLGYSGAGVTVSHNDSGVDLEHPDLVGAVTATVGRMTYTDTGHGTHTAGSIVGRGTSPAPVNTSGCGDPTGVLSSVRGMAWGADLVTNNIFEDGYGQVAEMMAWAVRNGAQLSSNSWGQVGLGDPVTGYTAAARDADAAVRDADPGADGPQPLAIFFSAGNVGPAPGTITSPATAKNVITIGAVENDRCGAWVPGHQPGPDPEAVVTSSGRGPSQGRIKPDLAAPGSDVLSPESTDPYSVQVWDQDWTGPAYAINSGTSQACAVAAGAGAVLHEYLWRSRGRRPSPALLKAALIVAANNGGVETLFDRGWGRVDAAAAVAGPVNGAVTLIDADETDELVTGESWGTQVVVRSSGVPLGLALVWTDVPGEEDSEHPLVNDLDLVLTSPSGGVYRGNVFSGGWSVPDPGTERDGDNNVEVVRIEFPEPGTWIAEVVGVDVAASPAGLEGQDFAVAISGDAGPCVEAPPPPAVVEAAQLGDNRIRVEWSAVSGATRYELSRADRSGGHPYSPISTLPAGVGSFIDTDVSGGSEYFYVVRAYRDCWSVYSTEASATAVGACRLPPVFAGLASVESPAGASCALELVWERVESLCPGVTAYSVYRGDEPDFEPGPDNRLVETVVSSGWLDQRLEWGRDYFYVVRASHYGQDFDDGNTVVVRGRPVGPLDIYLDEDVEGAVDGWILEPGSGADSGTEPWRVTEDDVWAGDRAWFVGDEDRVKDQVLLRARPITFPDGAEPVLEFHHRYRLHNRRDGGRLEYSTNGGLDWVDILEGDGQAVPADPQRWLTGGYSDSIGAPSNPLFLADAWTGDSRGWIHSRVDLADFVGRRILFRWRLGCDETPGTGSGWWLDGIRVVQEHECRPCPVADPPSGLAAEATDQGVMLEWDTLWGGDRYLISRALEIEGPFETIAVVNAPETSYHDTSASGGTTYTYVYAAANDECRSDNSAGSTVTAGGPCTMPPDFWGLDAVHDPRDTGCAMDLEWRPATPGCAGATTRHRVYRSESPGFQPGPETLIADHVAGPRYRDLSVVDGVLYHYRVRAVDGASLAEEGNPVIHSGWTTGPDEVHFSDSAEGDLDAWRTGRGSSQDSGTEPWKVVEDFTHGGSRSWFCSNEPRVKDQVLGLVAPFAIDDESTVLSFFHFYDLEPFWDGGRLEYSTDGGSTWHDILLGDGVTVGDNPERFLKGPYTGFVSVGTGHPFGGERAWTGFDNGWTETVIDLADFVGLTVQFRWRLGCDRADARVGWWLDDVELRTTSRCETVQPPAPRFSQGRHP
jgi:subtilisin family serine protease